jgi:hypothetical protein
MTTETNTAPVVVDMGTIALRDAVKAVANDDRATYNAVVSLALVMASRQVNRLEAGDDVTDKANKATFRAFLKEYAYRGHMAWRDTDHLVAQIAAKPAGKVRRAAASDYIDGGKHAGPTAKPEGARLVDGLARLRTYSFRLMKHVLANHADIVVEIRDLKASGADAEAQVGRFRRFVAETYGESFAALSGKLRSDAPVREKSDAIESIVKRAGDMTDSELQVLVSRLQALFAERMAAAAEVAETFGGEADEAEAETEESIAA